MYQTALELTRLCDLHLLDPAGLCLAARAARGAGAEVRRRLNIWCGRKASEKQFGSILPHAVREFASQELEWRMHREMYLREIDVVQLEYTTLGQYGGDYRRIACVLFEHDIYFQSIARGVAGMREADCRESSRATSICGRCGTSCGCCRASIGCRCAVPKTATTCCRSCRGCGGGLTTIARASRRRGMNFAPAGREP